MTQVESAVNRDAQLVVFSLPSDNPERLVDFYSNIMNTRFTCTFESEKKSYTDWISKGVKFNIGEKHHPNEKPMFHIAVSDIEKSTSKIKEQGGDVYPSMELKIHQDVLPKLHTNYEAYIDNVIEKSDTLGKSAIAKDVDGNFFGIMQLEPWAKKFFDEGKVHHSTNFEIESRIELCDALNQDTVENTENNDEL